MLEAQSPMVSEPRVSFSPSTFQSKHCIIIPRTVGTTCRASEAPGQLLLPLPNGNRLKCCPLTSKNWFFPCLHSSLRNRSGTNSRGLSHCFGSLPRAHTLTKSLVPSGIS
ncbi:hypothetical protein QQP08_017439 [Theobroma cacao]|nr:hypothetical protein QQP08_017439 [Theobroma cacao]